MSAVPQRLPVAVLISGLGSNLRAIAEYARAGTLRFDTDLDVTGGYVLIPGAW